MKLRILSIAAGVCISFISSCQSVKPDAGQVGVIIKKPWIFGEGGVSQEMVETGREYIAISSDYVYVDVRPEQHVIEIDDLMTKDGVPLDFSCIARTRVLNAATLIEKFGENWFNNNLRQEILSYVREAVKKHGLNETAINVTAIQEIDDEVTAKIKEMIANVGIPVELLSFTAGRANPPDSVKNQRMETAAQEQRSLTEKMKVNAEVQREIAERARAKADKAYQEELSLSTEQFLELQKMKMQERVCFSPSAKCEFVISPGVPVMKIF